MTIHNTEDKTMTPENVARIIERLGSVEDINEGDYYQPRNFWHTDENCRSLQWNNVPNQERLAVCTCEILLAEEESEFDGRRYMSPIAFDSKRGEFIEARQPRIAPIHFWVDDKNSTTHIRGLPIDGKRDVVGHLAPRYAPPPQRRPHLALVRTEGVDATLYRDAAPTPAQANPSPMANIPSKAVDHPRWWIA